MKMNRNLIKYLITIILILFIPIIVLSQVIEVRNAGMIDVNGKYFSTTTQVTNDAHYYIRKTSSNTYYLYQLHSTMFNKTLWIIGLRLGADFPESSILYVSFNEDQNPENLKFESVNGYLPAPTVGDYPTNVEISDFTITDYFGDIKCSCTTNSEFENIGFILERRDENTDWVEIASYKTDDQLKGQGTTLFTTNYEYTDKYLKKNSTYYYRIGSVNYNGLLTYHAIRSLNTFKGTENNDITNFELLPAYPNPFNPTTTLNYAIPNNNVVKVMIYDLMGNHIKTLLNKEQVAGWHQVQWNGTNHNNKNVPAGIYLGRITSNKHTKTTKLMLLK